MVIQIVFALIILMNIHWLIPVTLVFFTLPYVFLYKKMCFDQYFLKVNQGKEYRKNWYLIQMLFDKNFNKELKIYDCFDYMGKKEQDINIKLHRESYAIAKKYSLFTILLDVIKGIGKGFCILISIYLILFQNASLAALTVPIESMDSMQNGLLKLFSKVKDFNSALLLFNDYMKFLNIDSEEPGFEGELQDERKEPFLAVNHLSFGYPAKPNVLKDISFSIYSGEKVAIVGENGSGKTTLVNLLLGLYKPDQGNIEVLGTDLRQCFAQLRRNVVYIMQNLPQYGFSIEENLYFNQKRMKETNSRDSGHRRDSP